MKAWSSVLLAMVLAFGSLGCDEEDNCFNDPRSCDDGDPCTDDYCDMESGMCATVDSEDFRCADNDPCTVDKCVPDTGVCSHDPCNDLDPCTADSCDPDVGCLSVSVCDDGNPCTSDQCNRTECRAELVHSCDAGNTACTDVCNFDDCEDAGNTESYCQNNCIREIRNECADQCYACHTGTCDAKCGDLCDWLDGDPMAVCDPVTNPSNQHLKQCGKELCSDLELCTEEQLTECRVRCEKLTCAFKCLEDDRDWCDANEFCTNTVADDGSSCGDAFDFTDDLCQQGACVVEINTAPETFRVDQLTLVTPAITYDLGNGPVEVNDLIGAFMTASLDDYDFGGLVAAFDAIDYAFTGASVLFGEGACTFYTGGGPEACALLPWGGQAGFDTITWATTGTCSTDPAVPAPCFLTAEGAFDLHAIIPDVIQADSGEIMGHAAGQFEGDPMAGIVSGVVEGVIPEALIDLLSDQYPIDLGENPTTIKALLKDVDKEDVPGGGQGYRVRLGFTADKVDALSLPQGCNKDPGQCEAETPPETCNPFTGDCS